MFVEALRLLQFRNYSEAEIKLNPQINLFFGQNGQGKTNILEAVQLLLTGESFRPGTPHDFIQSDRKFEPLAKAQAEVMVNGLRKSLEFRIAENKKINLINEKSVNRTLLKSLFSTVVFSPDSLELIKSGPLARRTLLDEIMCSLEAKMAFLLFDYAKCLKTRNRILKNLIDGFATRSETESLLESINELFLPLAAQLTQARTKTAQQAIARAKSVFKEILKDSNVDISVEYVISSQSAIDWSPNQVYDSLSTRLQELKSAEMATGQSLVGPHKHDVQFNFNGKEARLYCSQGQQRMIALAFKVTQILLHYERYGGYPVLLLDDVFSELDSEKRESFLQILSGIKAQIFLTTTELENRSYFGHKDMTVFEIKKGNVITSGWN